MNWLRRTVARLNQKLNPPAVERGPAPETLAALLSDGRIRESMERQQYRERVHELFEARQMAGSGPWLPAQLRESVDVQGLGTRVREANMLSNNTGAYGDIELALQNVEWRREINFTWLEFSRWGIQQIILICRLYFIKNPIVRRLIGVCSDYVFARGVEISSTDEGANEALRIFFEENKTVLGQNALAELERRKDYDGNIFFAFFTDKASTGKVKVRTIDTLEILDVVTDPDDATQPRYYRRSWSQRTFDPRTGEIARTTQERWYPALGYEPTDGKPPTIAGVQVEWDTPIYHRKEGAIAGWSFGCPRAYPMIDWARASKDFLTACATVKQALSQIALTLTTKGGQQALEGAKQQLQTQVGPGGGQSLWDSNPPAVQGSIFASGPGTKLEAFKTAGAGENPEGVRQFKLMCCMVANVPETFLGDVSTGNLATATSLDRPTETSFISKQESWVEDLTVIATYALKASAGAPGGALRESLSKRTIELTEVRGCPRVKGIEGRWKYVETTPQPGEIQIRVNFPAIREGDIPTLIEATVKAMTLNGKQAFPVGIDEKEGVRKLLNLLDIDGADEIVEAMYPTEKYDRERQPVPLPEPQYAAPMPKPGPATAQQMEAAVNRLTRALESYRADLAAANTNGNA